MSSIHSKLTAGVLALTVLAGVSVAETQAGGSGCHTARIPAVQPIRLGLKGRMCHRGMQLTFVQPGAFACQLGLKPGDVIFAINRIKIRCTDDYFKGLHKAVFLDRGFLKMGVYRRSHCGQLRAAFVKANLHPQMIGHGGVVATAPVHGFQGQQAGAIQGFQGQQLRGIPQPGQQIPGQQFQGLPQQGQQVPVQQFPGRLQQGQQTFGQQIVPQQQSAGQAVQGFTVSADLLRRAR
ncbi:MAG: hypothetical protein MPJ50_03105 [Pirellulales bacterium]|nr:hypothetical protein [Pirellulales bacterium]